MRAEWHRIPPTEVSIDTDGEIVPSGETGLPDGAVVFEPSNDTRTDKIVARLRAALEGAFTPLEWRYPALAERGPPRLRVEVFDGELPG